jgi:hypothetical protein
MAKEKLTIIKPKKKRNSKRIGKGFEWEVCKKLSSSCKGKDIFMPTKGSGLRGTVRKKAEQDSLVTQHGDITYENLIGKPLIDIWSIECKSGYTKTRETKQGITKTGWCVLDCIEGNNNPKFLEFWLQAIEDAEVSNREPVLIFRRANKQACITFDYDYFFDVLKPLNNKLFKEWDYDSISLNIEKTILFIMSFSDFLDWTNNNLLNFAKEITSEKNKQEENTRY